MIKVTLTPKSKQVMIDIGDALPKTKTSLEQAMFEIGDDVVKEIKRLIKIGPKTGRVYRFSGRNHTASAPGQAPANRTGRLAKSANYRVRNWQQMEVGEYAEYAAFLELGTRRMIKRPHVIAAINNRAGNTYITIEQAVRV